MRRKIRLHRLAYLAAFIASAVLIGLQGGAPVYLMFWGLVLMPVCSFVFRKIVRAGVVIRLDVDASTTTRGERLHCSLRVINETFLPIPEVRIHMHDGKVQFPLEEQEIVCSLAPGEERVFSFTPLCRHLGAALIGADRIEIPDWFCLTAAAYERTERIHILPRRQHMESVEILPPREKERRQIDRSYFGEQVPDGQWRMYQPGDDIRRMHWKLTARQQRPIMKNLIPEPKNEMVLIPDGRQSLPEGRTGWICEDSIVEGTLAIADYFLRFGIALKVAPDMKRQVSLIESSAYEKLYALMARGYFTGSARPDQVLMQMEQTGGANHYIILTWELDEEMIRSISGVISRGASVSLIYIGDDTDIASLAAAERKLSFYQVTSGRDIFAVLKGSAETGGAA